MRALDETSLNQQPASVSPFHLPRSFPSFLLSCLGSIYFENFKSLTVKMQIIMFKESKGPKMSEV